MLLYALDLIGVAVFAVSGALAAGRKRLDLLGVVVLALVTAIGGGTIRDVLLDRHPIFWLVEPAYLVVIVAAALGTVVYARFAGTAVYFLLETLGVGRTASTVSGMAVVAGLRLAAIWWRLQLPEFRIEQADRA